MQELLFGGVTMRYPDSAFRLSTDSVLLADFAQVRPKSAVCDLGCGCGAISLMLCGREPTLTITGVEIQKAAAACARQNAIDNALRARFSIVEGDLRSHRQLLPCASFDAVVSNPPYYRASSGFAPNSEALSIARTEQCCTLDDLCRCAAWLLRTGGGFFLVHKPERLADVICALRQYALEPKRIRFVRHHPGAPVSLVLFEARKGAKPDLRFAPDLVLFTPDGRETDEYRTIYHMQEVT